MVQGAGGRGGGGRKENEKYFSDNFPLVCDEI